MNAVEAFDRLMDEEGFRKEFEGAYETNLRVSHYGMEAEQPDFFLAAIFDVTEKWRTYQQKQFANQSLLQKVWYRVTKRQPIIPLLPQREIIIFSSPASSFFLSGNRERIEWYIGELKILSELVCYVFRDGELQKIEREEFFSLLRNLFLK